MQPDYSTVPFRSGGLCKRKGGIVKKKECSENGGGIRLEAGKWGKLGIPMHVPVINEPMIISTLQLILLKR